LRSDKVMRCEMRNSMLVRQCDSFSTSLSYKALFAFFYTVSLAFSVFLECVSRDQRLGALDAFCVQHPPPNHLDFDQLCRSSILRERGIVRPYSPRCFAVLFSRLESPLTLTFTHGTC
jgi:hypothetical protein